MRTSAPQSQLVLDYKHFFGISPPEDRISLIKHISSDTILCEIAALNYRLHPKNQTFVDVSFETQAKELCRFSKSAVHFRKYSRVAQNYTNKEHPHPIIFSRQACVFALEEILNSSEMQVIPEYRNQGAEIRDATLNYLLAINCEITAIKEDEGGNIGSLESLNPKLLPLNELLVPSDPIQTIYRSFRLIEFLSRRKGYGTEVHNYFQREYGLEAEQFVFKLMSIYFRNSNEDPELNVLCFADEDHYAVFDKLSQRVHQSETKKLISIRKWPLIRLDKLKFLIADTTFLIDKAYGQYLNDFWFDMLKQIHSDNGRTTFSFSHYKAEFGYFIEQYLSELLSNCFENYKYSTLLTFEKLRIQTSKGQIEIADIYFRSSRKILLGQVKSASIYDLEKFGGDVESLYKKNRTAFFANFGVDQMIASLTRMDEMILQLDSRFPKGHSYEVYPCIIVNDKALQTPLMANIFNIRFQELLNDFKVKKVRVWPLSLIHISDFERIEVELKRNPKQIWELLRYNHRDKTFVPPFFNTINLRISRLEYSEKITNFFQNIILKYNPKGANK